MAGEDDALYEIRRLASGSHEIPRVSAQDAGPSHLPSSPPLAHRRASNPIAE
ncbi:hypothetical protein E2562_017771, partial [Oryza meyeriana var. granulata]